MSDDGIARRERPAPGLRQSWQVVAEPAWDADAQRQTVRFRCDEKTSCRCRGEEDLQLPERFTVASLIRAIAHHRIEHGS